MQTLCQILLPDVLSYWSVKKALRKTDNLSKQKFASTQVNQSVLSVKPPWNYGHKRKSSNALKTGRIYKSFKHRHICDNIDGEDCLADFMLSFSINREFRAAWNSFLYPCITSVFCPQLLSNLCTSSGLRKSSLVIPYPFLSLCYYWVVAHTRALVRWCIWVSQVQL